MSSAEQEIAAYFDRLWPICRSLTGAGVRESLDILSELVPMERYRIASGSKVFDWEVPQEWNIRAAWLENPAGERIADLAVNNLHVWSYSTPIQGEFSYEELLPHIRTLPQQPNAIPYVTTYYKRAWGFCLDHNTWQKQPREGTYKVMIDSDLSDGFLDYGEAILPGSSDREVLFSTYVCHPSMANNELSGPLVQAFLYRLIAGMANRRYTYRFVFAPETIGIVGYLDRIGQHLKTNLDAGYVITCVGDRGELTYKRSKRETSLADRVAEHVLRHSGKPHRVIPFAVGGSDERQYCSPGFNLPVGSLMRTPYQQYAAYHTSLDNRDFISFEHLQDTIDSYFAIVQVLELNRKYCNTVAHCEPQLGKRGLYPSSVNPDDSRQAVHDLLHLLAFADGDTDLLEIADRRGCSALRFADAIQQCLQAKILV
jgi:aminopeptidase-like protein